MSCVLSTYLHGAFDCVFFSCHIHVSRWIHILHLPKVHKTPCLKQVRNLKFKWLQLDLNSEPLSLSTNTKPFGQSGQMIELCSEYLSAQCIWLYVLVVSHTCFRVSPRYSCLKVKELLAWSRHKIWSLSSLSNSNYFTSAKKCQCKSCVINFTSAKVEFASASFKNFYFST